MNVKDLVGKYVNSTRYRNLSPNSQHQYWQALKKVEDLFGSRDVTTIKRADIMLAHDKLGKTPATANRFVRVTSILFNYALDMDFAALNPATRVKLYKINEFERWEEDEVKKVIAAGDRVVSTAVALAFYTGQREADVLKMKWSSIKNGHLILRQGKTGEELKIKLSPELVAVLKKLPKNPDEYIVSGKHRMTGPAFRSAFKRFTRKLGIERQFHGIRKTVGSILAERGCNTNEIAALLGHRTLAMAEKYTRQANETKMISSAVNVLSAS